MSDAQITDEEWAVFSDIAGRLGIDISRLVSSDASFTELESAAHRLGREVSQAATERMTFTQMVRIMSRDQPCPDCGKFATPDIHEREFETIDGPIKLKEPICHCSTCRRDFFPSP